MRRRRRNIEQPRFEQLVEVDCGAYKSRAGGYVKLEFAGKRFVYIHMATEEIYNQWIAAIGTYHWIIGSWKKGPHDDTVYREWRLK